MTRARIRKELDHLRKKVQAAWKRHEKEPHYGDHPFICPNVGVVGRCTDSSTYLAERLGGWVYGYQAKDNPTAEVGADEGGHDFVVIDDRWLVDFWAWDSYELPDLYDMQDPLEQAQVRRRYGDPARWEKMSPENFKYWKRYIKELP